jgi:DNA repair exonuclease SbcCD ATPase subunit
MRKGAIIALVIALVAAGFLGGRLLSSGQEEGVDQALQLRVSQLEQRMEELAARSTSERFTALEDRLARLREQVEGLAAQTEALSRLESQLQTHRGRLDLLERAFSLGAAATEDVNGKIAALTEQISQLSRALEEMKGETRWADREELQGLAQRVKALEELPRESALPLRIGIVDLARVSVRLPGLEEAELERVLEQIGQSGGFDLILRTDGEAQGDLVLYARPGSLIDVTEQVISFVEQEELMGTK